MTNLILRANVTSNDTAYADMGSGEDFYIDMVSGDYFIFSDGSDAVKDGESIPSDLDLNRAAPLLDDLSEVEVDKYFLADISDSDIKEIINAGRVAKRYVFCASFDGATASEPALEAWDSEGAYTFNSACLGAGTASDSWYKAICTTDSTPASSWAGTILAGSNASYRLLLNNSNGALSSAKDLYFNFAVVIPPGIENPTAEVPILLITYTTN